MLKQYRGRLHIKQVVSPPLELDEPSFRFFERFGIIIDSIDGDVDVPKCFGDEGLDASVLVDDEAKGGELAGTCKSARIWWTGGGRYTVRDDLLGHFWYSGLKRHGHQSGESCSDPQVERYPSLDGIRLSLIEVVGLSACLVDLAEDVSNA